MFDDTTKKMIYDNTVDFEWCRLVTIPDTQNNRCEIQTYSQPTL
jgi:hypothetical protein